MADLTDPRIVTELDRAVTRFHGGQRRVHHLLVGLRDRATGTTWLRTRGQPADRDDPLTVDTPYHIASVTKLFTTVAVLRLVEQGRLHLNGRVVANVPWGLIDGLLTVDGVDRTAEITVEHLLRQTSGLPDYFERRGDDGESLRRRLLRGEDRTWDVADAVRIARDELEPRHAPSAPGARAARAHYADTNFQLLGAVLEHTCEQELEEIYQEHILDPIALDDTFLAGSRSVRPTRFYAGDLPLDLPQAMRSFGPDGGLVSTLSDQLAFLDALVDGRLFDDPGTFRRMTDRFVRMRFPFRYGLGIARFALPRAMSPGAPFPPLVGHAGATGSWLWHCPELGVDLAGTVDQAASPSLPYRLIPRLVQIVARAG